MKNDPLQTIKKLVAERYRDAKAVFWAGSVSNNQGTPASDLDLVVVYEQLPNAYREAFVYEKWPIDVFVHDSETLLYFFEESRAGNGISGLIYMILNGREITEPNVFSQNIKKGAKEILKKGPAMWDKEQVAKERFLITDVLHDIKTPTSREEQIASAAWLFEALSQFYFRSRQKWCASGKSIVRYLKDENPEIAKEFTQSFDKLFRTGETADLEILVEKILAPFGGLHWDGYYSQAPKEFKLTVAGTLEKTIQQLELSLLEPLTRQSTGKLNQLISDDFVEFGSSGKAYNKQDIIENLPSEDLREFSVRDFKATELSKGVVLATYTTIEKEKVCLRSSIWKNLNGDWCMVFHQGTPC